MTKINQCSLVLNQLMRSGRITAAQAKAMGIKNLSAKVKELRNLGVPVSNAEDGGYIFPEWLRQARNRKTEETADDNESKLFQ